LAALNANVFRLPLAAEPKLAANGEEYTLIPDEGIALRVLIRKPKDLIEKAPAVLYVASDGDDPAYVWSLLGGVQRRGRSVQMVVYPRGTGEIGWDHTFWKATLRNAMHVGQTIDSMRLADVIQAFRALATHANVDPARITVAGKGMAGALALYAAILEPRVHQVMLIDPPASHQEGPIFLGILRHTDLPEAAALLAPRRLNFYSRMPAAYAYTRDVYGLLGVGDNVFVAMDMDTVVSGKYHHNFSSGY
jgi:hypothetical protein